LLVGYSLNPFNNIGSRSSKFTIAIMSKINNSSNPMVKLIQKINVQRETLTSKSSRFKGIEGSKNA
jgi:hypothetical protein